MPEPEIWLNFDELKGVDILADILQHSTLDQPVSQRTVPGHTVVQRCSCLWAIFWSVPRGHLDFERGVILRELEEVEKTTEEASAAFCSHPTFQSDLLHFDVCKTWSRWFLTACTSLPFMRVRDRLSSTKGAKLALGQAFAMPCRGNKTARGRVCARHSKFSEVLILLRKLLLY